ncbi:MAG: PilN domain-containing protein [Patescibacteria group bacterium]
MINLLPLENKKALKKEYLRRFIIVAGAGLFLIIIFLLLIAVIIFFTANSQKRLYEERFSFAIKKLRSPEDQEIINFISDVNSKISNLNQYQKPKSDISQLIEEIIYLKSDDIKINSFLYQANGEKDDADTITITGLSKTRRSLSDFSDNLRKIPEIKDVVSPISNFLRSENVEFNISIKINE